MTNLTTKTDLLGGLQAPAKSKEATIKLLAGTLYDYRMNGKEVAFFRHGKNIGNKLKIKSLVSYSVCEYEILFPKHDNPTSNVIQCIVIVDKEGVLEAAHIAFTTDIAKQQIALLIDDLLTYCQAKDIAPAEVPFELTLDNEKSNSTGKDYCTVLASLNTEDKNGKEYTQLLHDFLVANQEGIVASVPDFTKFAV